MPRTCVVCGHPERSAIERGLISGVPQRALAARYGPSRSALQRHRAEHVPQVLARVAEQAADVHATNLLDQLRAMQGRAHAYEVQAALDGDYRGALAALREQREVVRLLCDVQGPPPECKPQATILWSFDPMTAFPDLPSANGAQNDETVVS